jgi:hypothetical protein
MQRSGVAVRAGCGYPIVLVVWARANLDSTRRIARKSIGEGEIEEKEIDDPIIVNIQDMPRGNLNVGRRVNHFRVSRNG